MTDTQDQQRYELDVYFDFLCPFAYQGSEWLREVRDQLGPDRLKITWRYFPLDQVNSTGGPTWKYWEQSDEDIAASRGGEGFRGALAARQQGDELFEKFHQAWFRARHGDLRIKGKRPSVDTVAESVGLDMDRFLADKADRSLLAKIGEDYEHGRNAVGVFGVPTLVFSGGESAYVKVRPKPPTEDALAVWREVTAPVLNRPYLTEIKRPTPPTS